MQDQNQNRTTRGLPRYVGVQEVCAALGVSKSTLDRLRRHGEFPPHQQLSPGRVGWPVEVIEQHLMAQARSVASHSVSNPDDLSPDELEDQARIYAAQAISKRTGNPVDPAALALHATRRLTEGDFTALETEEHRFRADYLSRLTVDQALVVVAVLLPQLRPVLMNTASPRARAVLKDAKLVDTNFKLVSDFLTLFELQTRLTDAGLQFSGGQTVLDRLAEFGSGRAMVLSAWLFPELRPIYADSVGEMDRPIFSDEETLRQHAMATLNDDKWAEFCAEQRAKDQGNRGDDPTSPTIN